MPRIINTFASPNPLAEGLSSIGKSMWGDTLTPALKKQDLRDKERVGFGMDNFARVAGMAKDGVMDPNAAAEMGVLAGMKPEDAAMWNVFLAGNKLGPRAAPTTNAMAGAGKYENSAENLDLNRDNLIQQNTTDNNTQRYGYDKTAETSLANNTADNARAITTNTADNTQKMYEFTNTPEEAYINGQPGFVNRGDLTQTPQPGAPNYTPILDQNKLSPEAEVKNWMMKGSMLFPNEPEKQRAWVIDQMSKAKSKGMTVYGPDGPILEMGGDGGSGPFDPTNANLTKLQGNEVESAKFTDTLTMARDMITQNPNSVGLIGQARGGAQDLGTIAQGVGTMFGIQDVGGALEDAKAEATSFGLSPDILSFDYDPSVAGIESVMNILAFQGARAIGGQSGNDLSDKDIKAIKSILGDPTSLFTTQNKLLARLDLVDKYVTRQRAINTSFLQRKGAPAATPGASPAAPAASPLGQKVINGKTYTQQNGQWFEVAP